MPFKQITQANFTKGLNTVTGKATPIPNSVKRISNLIYSRRGSLKSPDGVLLYSQTVDWFNDHQRGPTNFLQAPCAIHAAVRGPNLFPLVVSWNEGGYSPYDISRNPCTRIALSGDSGFWVGNGFFDPGHTPSRKWRIPQLINVNNLVVMCTGNDATGVPYADFYNLVKGQVGTQPPTVTAAAHGSYHQGFLWLWNTSYLQGSIDGPATLRMCVQDATGAPDITNFPANQYVKVDPNDGTQGRGCISFTSSEAGIAPTATLVLFKDYSTYQVTGLLSPSGGLSITRAQTEMGCVASRTIQFAPGFGIIRLTHFGVAVFDGAKDTLISEEIRPYFFHTDPDITPINWNRVEIEASATFTYNPPMYVVAVPVEGHAEGCQRLLCYDLILKVWTSIDVPYQGGSFFSGGVGSGTPILTTLGPIGSVKLGSTQPTTLLATKSEPQGSYASMGDAILGVFRWQAGDGAWPMGWSVTLPDVFGQSPDQPLYVRRTVLRAKTPQATITGVIQLGGSNLTMSDTVPFMPLSNQSIYGLSKYGFATYSSGDQDLIGMFDFGVRAFSAGVTYTGPAGPIEIMSNSWHIVPKPTGTPARVS